MDFQSEQDTIQNQILELLGKFGYPQIQLKWTWIPFSGHWGISTSFFQVASQKIQEEGGKSNTQDLAVEISRTIADKLLLSSEYERVEAVKGYLNIYFHTSTYAKRIIDHVLLENSVFGSGPDSGLKVMIEFSQPNTHKAFHVGHLRNMVLGSAVSNILEFAGHTVIRANYLGDIGLHVITWLWNYQKYHAGQMPPKENKTRWMGDLYSEAVKRLEKDPTLDTEIRELFKRWDNKENDIVELWERTRNWSMEAFEQVYDLLGIKFDRVYFESEVEEPGKVIVDELITRGLAKDERPEGAVIVDLDSILGFKEKYRVLVVLRSDGTSLYPTKDLPLAIMKFNEYNLDKSIYVIDVRQSLYMQQIFKLLELMGYSWAGQCVHLAYEIVNLPGNVTIASRDGTVVLLEDLITEATNRALEIVEGKNPGLTKTEKEAIAKKVAVGAIKYSLLSKDNTKIITFNWDSALDVNGQAAPYIQYAAVRANSILRKVNFQIPESESIQHDLTQQEIELINLISRFPIEVQNSAREMRPLLLTSLSYEIAKAFSNFYNNCPVLDSEPLVRNFRLRLVSAAKQVITNSLNLLGIEVPEIM